MKTAHLVKTYTSFLLFLYSTLSVVPVHNERLQKTWLTGKCWINRKGRIISQIKPLSLKETSSQVSTLNKHTDNLIQDGCHNQPM